MNHIIKNAWAVLRGNILCILNVLPRGGKYKNLIRMFKDAGIKVHKGGRVILGKGVTIGERSLCAVTEEALFQMGDMSFLNSDCKIVCRHHIQIGDRTIFGPNVMVYDHDHLFDSESGVKPREYKCSEVIIGKNCWIGANTVILRGTHIGDSCLIGAGSVIKGNIPSGSKVIQKRETIVLGRSNYENTNSN